jgi:hypothetical protein
VVTDVVPTEPSMALMPPHLHRHPPSRRHLRHRRKTWFARIQGRDRAASTSTWPAVSDCRSTATSTKALARVLQALGHAS